MSTKKTLSSKSQIDQNASTEPIDYTHNAYGYWAEIIASVVAFCVFIILFYFTVASNVEGQVVQKNVNIIVDDFTLSAKSFIPASATAQFDNEIQNALVLDSATLADLNEQDANATASNQSLLKTAITAVVAVVIVGVVAIAFLYYRARKVGKPFSLTKIIKTVLIITVFIAITEYLFLTLCAANFISADPNYVKKSVIDNIVLYGSS